MYTFNAKSAFYVKYFSDADRLYVQLFKDGWQFPEDGVDVPLNITFDNGPAYPALLVRGWTQERMAYQSQ